MQYFQWKQNFQRVHFAHCEKTSESLAELFQLNQDVINAPAAARGHYILLRDHAINEGVPEELCTVPQWGNLPVVGDPRRWWRHPEQEEESSW